jgi:radical SAM superfamily enzyme YgiQ (UPF0313 family)
MHLVLVDNLLLEHGGWTHHLDLQPHLGLISLAAVAEAHGHRASLYDPKMAIASGQLRLEPAMYREMADAIAALEPDVVGFTSLGCNFICTLKAAGYLKAARPDLPILVGGPHVSILHREVAAAFPQFDVVVRGEAEASLPPLLDALTSRRFDDVPGVTFRRGSDVVETPQAPLLLDLDQLPWPAFDHYPIEQMGIRSLRVEAGRGCPFDCTFCSTASFFGRRYRLKSPERLVAELDFLHERYGISEFALMHDLFTVSKAKVRDFCDAVADRDYGWRCSARMDCVDADLLERMRDAGCRSIYYGVETGSPRMQTIVSKHLDLGLYHPVLATTLGLGIRPTASFITGYPEETSLDQEETLDLIGASIARYPELLTLQLHLLTPEPGTELIAQYGSQLAYDGHVSDFNFPTLEPDDAQVMASHPDIFMNHHYYPGQLPRRRHILVTTAYLALSQLGFTVLRELLEAFDGRLSRLMDALIDWTGPDGAESVSPALVEAFVAARFGSNDHRLSLVRYRFACARLIKQAEATPRGATAPADGELVMLAPWADVLGDALPAPLILEHLERGADPGSVPGALRSRRSDYLLVADPGARHRVRAFELNPITTVLVERLRQPTSAAALLHAFQGPEFEPDRVHEAIDGLMAVDAVIAVGTQRQAPGGARSGTPSRALAQAIR